MERLIGFRQKPKTNLVLVYISLGSLVDLETQIIIATNLDFIDNTYEIHENIVYIKKLLHGK